MKNRTILKSFFLMVLLATVFIFATVQSAVSEMTLNDNVNIEGDIFLNGTGGGIIFPDGSEQRTAASPPWSKVITTERFELVLYNEFRHEYEAVLDHETGLVWERETHERKNWNYAQSYCYMLELGGRKGWRLPTVDELATLVDSSHNKPALPPDNYFIKPQSDYYWSSTTKYDEPKHAWLVSFKYGVIGYGDMTHKYYVRAVRAGQ
jgi:hypothetical protein